MVKTGKSGPKMAEVRIELERELGAVLKFRSSCEGRTEELED